MSRLRTMTDAEIMAALRSDTPLSRACRILHSAYAEIEQGMEQRRPLSALDVRNIEFDAVKPIAACFGATVERFSGTTPEGSAVVAI